MILVVWRSKFAQGSSKIKKLGLEIKDLKTDNNCCCPKDNLRADFFDKCSKLENFRISLTLSFLLLDI